MNTTRRPASKRKLQVDPRFELKIDTFVNSDLDISPLQTSRDPNSTTKHLDFNPKKSKITQKFDASCYPEEVIGIHTYGYAVAHKKYSENLYGSYEKQWEDDERLRKCKSARVRSPVDPIKRTRDQHVLERIIENSVKRKKVNELYSLRYSNVMVLPSSLEGRHSERSSQRFISFE